MVKQVGKKFTWAIEGFSSLKAGKCYSDPFAIGGCKWRVLVFPKGNAVDYLSFYLVVADSESLSPGWRRHAKFRLTVVNQLSKESSQAFETQHKFNASEDDWGFTRGLRLTELSEGFLVDDTIIIELEVDVLEVTGKLDVSVESEKPTAALIKTVGLQAADEPANGPLGDSLCLQEPEFVDASQENSDHAASSPVSEGGGGDTSSQWELVQDASETLQNASVESNNVASLVTVSSAAEASDNLLEEIQPEIEIVDVNGFQILSSQVEFVKRICERHPDFASDFRLKTQQLRSASMDVLLGLIETLCLPPKELIEDDLTVAANTLTDLTDVGFKLDWLKTKLEEVSSRKKKEQTSEARIPELEEESRKLKLRLSEIEAELQKLKAEVSAATVALLFDDVV